MRFEPKQVTLKDGRIAILRSPDPAKDAEDLCRYLYDTAADTPFVLRCPEEVHMTVEQEERFLRAVVDSPYDCMLLCEVEGAIAGNCHLMFNGRIKTAHRASVAIALRKAWWGLGIGTALLGELIALARAREGVRQLELEFIEGNARARALYEKMGFRITSVHPDAIRQQDGTLLNLYAMQLKL